MSETKREADEIRHEIERTRAAMEETVDEIELRLDPDHIKQQARQRVNETATRKVEEVKHWIKQGVRSVTSGDGRPERVSGEAQSRAEMAAAEAADIESSRIDEARHQGRDVAGTVQQEAAKLKDQAQHEAEQLKGKAKQEAKHLKQQAEQEAGRWKHQAQNQATRLQDRAQQQAKNLPQQFERTVRQHPMLAGVVAFAAGAVIGMAAPQPQAEKRVVGQAADRAVDRAM
jgi:ElaB/YqjD/DUF883 family membrane-anchored ribosome-binding protein